GQGCRRAFGQGDVVVYAECHVHEVTFLVVFDRTDGPNLDAIDPDGIARDQAFRVFDLRVNAVGTREERDVLEEPDAEYESNNGDYDRQSDLDFLGEFHAVVRVDECCDSPIWYSFARTKSLRTSSVQACRSGIVPA